jgi:hypothetical protein
MRAEAEGVGKQKTRRGTRPVRKAEKKTRHPREREGRGKSQRMQGKDQRAYWINRAVRLPPRA